MSSHLTALDDVLTSEWFLHLSLAVSVSVGLDLVSARQGSVEAPGTVTLFCKEDVLVLLSVESVLRCLVGDDLVSNQETTLGLVILDQRPHVT